jgi:hypothetical protein
MTMSRWIKWGLLVGAAMLAFVLVLAGAGIWYISSQMAPDVEIGQTMPAISLTSFGGEPISFESYRGRVVVLDFWSSW